MEEFIKVETVYIITWVSSALFEITCHTKVNETY